MHLSGPAYPQVYGPGGSLAPRNPPDLGTDVPWYYSTIPPTKFENDEEAVRFYASYLGIKSVDDLKLRIQQIRDRAWAVMPYPFLGQFRFLCKGLAASPFYESLVPKVKSGATVLDLGCGVGQDLRRLAIAAGQGPGYLDGDGRVTRYAADVRPEFWELGLDLFGDRSEPPAKFIQLDGPRLSNVLPQNLLKEVDGQIDVYLMCQFLDLFDWERQSFALQNVFRSSKVGSVIAGWSVGTFFGHQGEDAHDGHSLRFLHSPETLRMLWGDASDCAPKSTWKLDIIAMDPSAMGFEPVDVTWMEKPPKMALCFHAVREG